ncbi:ferredoxin-type protein NapF [Aromatoleum buckelii]|uniref:Ferredoxin-type protein NapF n=1 Tax=Aromatoleum buckelii TaxID=200254 RepID=A0ABX1N415_9RHOO|nr:ferredoxin-type protein NapF [Aromatoleum buckelii]MCK0510320.1 ferredoxin-type protein NapF [Aromatoleum buckelii]
MFNARRRFLTGSLRSVRNDLRPPWALVGDAFEDRCNRCNDCSVACPNGILVVGSGGFPKIDFSRGECSFCGDCAEACEAGALRMDSISAWQLGATIGAPCLAALGVECRVCGDACSVAAIRFRPRPGSVAQPHLDAERCNGCGACYAPCPVNAIGMALKAEVAR